jgi:hypothetical protein
VGSTAAPDRLGVESVRPLIEHKVRRCRLDRRVLRSGKHLKAAPVAIASCECKHRRRLARKRQPQIGGQALEAALEHAEKLLGRVLTVGQQVHCGVHIADPRCPGGVRANERRQAHLPRLDREDMTVAEQRLEKPLLALPDSMGERLSVPLLVDKRPHLEPGAEAVPLVLRAETADERQVFEQLVQTG